MRNIQIRFYLITSLFIHSLLCKAAIVPAQVLPTTTLSTKYKSIDSIYTRSKKVFSNQVNPNWISESSSFWYENNNQSGKQYVYIDCTSGNKQIFSSYEDLQQFIKPQPTSDTNGLESKVHTPENKLISPNQKYTVTIYNNNIWITDQKSGVKTQLSYNGAPNNGFSSEIHWSPSSEFFVAMQVLEAPQRTIPLIESTPSDQLQPRLKWINYNKPGDVLSIATPRLFSAKTLQEIPLNLKDYKHQYWLNFTGWNKESSAFTFEFNERGHQRYEVTLVDTTGNVKPIVKETSKTFIHYYKNYRYTTSDEKQLFWISERDGWRHLYRFDANTGKLTNQITKGNWVVRDVVWVDEANQTFLFKASGINKNEDPYNIHLCKIKWDGSGFEDLTPEQANHIIKVAPNKQYVVDCYSRPDMPTISVLRTITGKVITELEKADISELQKEGWTMPEVFSAKGRDGATDIWGTIFRPSHFNESKTYPVIEFIYAGPHDSHVNKNFEAYNHLTSRLCELGFIVVTIDGMGTANRSKAFHDVCWRNLKDAGFPDRIAWIKAAATKYKQLNIDNVGIYGYSAGGQSALGALLFHNDFYKVAVALCGCHDNRMDKIWWNEQWMGYPIGEWYTQSSNVVNAHLLKGKLMLINGEIDDNVDPASSLQVVKALINANKSFEMMYMPGYGHSLGGPYEMRLIHDFFVKNILHLSPPERN